MKKLISAILAVAILVSLAAVAGAETAPVILEKDGFRCEVMRDGNLRLVEYTVKETEGTTVNIPSSIDGHDIGRIGAMAFQNCKMAVVTIPTTVTMIEARAFDNCTEIQKITIPNNVFFMDGNPFTGCLNLANISLDPNHPTMEVTSDGALYSRMNKMLLCYPCWKEDKSFKVLDGTVTIGKFAFLNCDKLESIHLPSTVVEIGDEAFECCANLTAISLPQSLLTIGTTAFAGCKQLKTVAIPDQVLRIENSTFLNCESLESVTFSRNLTDICDQAFFGCAALKEIDLPANVNTIGKRAFYGCKELTSANVPVTVTEIGDEAFDACSVRLYMHVAQSSFAEIYAKLWDISFDYGVRNSFLDTGASE